MTELSRIHMFVLPARVMPENSDSREPLSLLYVCMAFHISDVDLSFEAYLYFYIHITSL